MKISRAAGKKVNREEEDFISDLRRRNESLQKENKQLQSKLKNASLTVQKYKSQLHGLKCRYSGSRNSFVKSTTTSRRYNYDASDDEEQDKNDYNENKSFCKGTRHRHRTEGCKVSIDDVSDFRYEYHEDVKVVLSQLQQRLLDTENKVKLLRAENVELKGYKEELERIQESKISSQQKESHEVSCHCNKVQYSIFQFIFYFFFITTFTPIICIRYMHSVNS